MRGDHPGQVRGGAERPPVHLGQAEHRIVGGDDAVGVAHQADPAAHAEPVHRGDHGDRALVDGVERDVATAVGGQQVVEPLEVLHLLDVDARVESPALGPEDHDVDVGVAARGEDLLAEFEPSRGRDGVDRWVVDRDGGYPVCALVDVDAHGAPSHATAVRDGTVTNQTLAW